MGADWVPYFARFGAGLEGGESRTSMGLVEVMFGSVNGIITTFKAILVPSILGSGRCL